MCVLGTLPDVVGSLFVQVAQKPFVSARGFTRPVRQIAQKPCCPTCSWALPKIWHMPLQRAYVPLGATERAFWILFRATWLQAILGAFYAMNDTDSSEYRTAAWRARSTASSASGLWPILFFISTFGITAIFPVALRSDVT